MASVRQMGCFVWRTYGKDPILYGKRMAKRLFVWQAYGKTLFLAHFCMAKCHKNRESAAFFRTVKLGFTELLKIVRHLLYALSVISLIFEIFQRKFVNLRKPTGNKKLH